MSGTCALWACVNLWSFPDAGNLSNETNIFKVRNARPHKNYEDNKKCNAAC